MTRLLIVYTLAEGVTVQKAVDTLLETRKDLPADVTMGIYDRGAAEVAYQLRWIPYGDIVQMLEFPTAAQADAFQETEAAKAQRLRCRHLFSNQSAVTFPVVEAENEVITPPRKK